MMQLNCLNKMERSPVPRTFAVQGVYDNGRIQLSENAPVEKANVIVVFPEAEKIEKNR